MTKGSMALCLAPESMWTSKLAFCLDFDNLRTDGAGPTKSPLLVLNQVKEVEPRTRLITWLFLAPSRYKDGKNGSLIGKTMANKPGFFHERNKTTMELPFDPDEIIIAWDLDPGEAPTRIPTAQYRDALVMLEAMDRARRLEEADD